MARPILFVIAGPNGAGKTTFYKTHLAPLTAAPFINADDIQRNELTDQSVEGAYQAATIAEYRRMQHLTARQSFITETVFSHPSKIEFIREAKGQGFDTRVFHVGVEHADLSVARVAQRVKEGGHPVPEEKIRARFDRNVALIREAVRMADTGYVYDNSGLNIPHRHVMTLEHGHVVKMNRPQPMWVQELYREDIERFQTRQPNHDPNHEQDRDR